MYIHFLTIVHIPMIYDLKLSIEEQDKEKGKKTENIFK